MNRIKVYIVGSVATRGCFAYTDKSIYEDIYDIVGLQYQSSFITLMSEPVEIDGFNLNVLHNWSKTIISRDFSKEFRQELIDTQPDYIIVDLTSEIEYGVINIMNSYITKINGKTNKINFDGLNIDEITIKKNKDLYIELFKSNFKKFRNFINENLSETKVIFHKSPFLYSYFEECRVPKSFRNKDLMWKNKTIDELYNHVIRENELVIDINDRTYFATAKHPISLNPIHYEKQYYIDFNAELNKIVLKDFIKGRELNA